MVFRTATTKVSPVRKPSSSLRLHLGAFGLWGCFLGLGLSTLPLHVAQAEPLQNGLSAQAQGYDDQRLLSLALDAARKRDAAGAKHMIEGMADPVTRKIATWALIDVVGEQLSFMDLEPARRELWGWPRTDARDEAMEKAMERDAPSPQTIVTWFKGTSPITGWGSFALARALADLGQKPEAEKLIKTAWRTQVFDVDLQNRILARFGSSLNADDHVVRLNTLLLGPQGPATRALLPLVPDAYRNLAEARMALRNDAKDADERFSQVPQEFKSDLGLAFERARQLRKRDQTAAGLAYAGNFPPVANSADSIALQWTERRNYMIAAMRVSDYQTAYRTMARAGFPGGEKRAEAEFFAGWVALTKLKDPALAEKHFRALRQFGQTTVTLARANYWLGRAQEAKGDLPAAKLAYTEGAKYPLNFYGQMAMEKAGLKDLVLPSEPQPSALDRQRFEARPLVQAIKRLQASNEKNLVKVFVLAVSADLPTAGEYGLMIDFALSLNDNDLAMKVARLAAQRGFILPERGFPLRAYPESPGAAEPALVMAITRQESGFDPKVRSGANARGMMQLLPDTAKGVAKRIGVGWSESSLYEADYNMRLGAVHLGELVRRFNGSYIMTAAGYNAGPGRPAQWLKDCGDPRQPGIDAIDYIECMPFSETRNYVMRIMENTLVYRARLNGGKTALTQSADIKRGTPAPLPSLDGLIAQTTGEPTP